jgi:REP element-mobilizing transposase RayT
MRLRGYDYQPWVPFSGRLWQRNYYEHVVRNEEDLAQIREYIANNPLRWALDSDNPSAATAGAKGSRP